MAETTEIRLPRLADSVTTVKFGAWLKGEGDRVEAGEPVAEVETDKTTVELEAPAAGVLCDLRVAPGADGLEVGAVLARIAPVAGEDRGPAVASPAVATPISAIPSPAIPLPAAGARLVAGGDGTSIRVGSPAALPGRAVPGVEPPGGSAPGESPAARDEAPTPLRAPPAAPGAAPAARDAAPADDAPAATPLALRMAAAAGLDLSAVRAAGADGRIRRTDIDRVLAARRGAPVEGTGVSEGAFWPDDGQPSSGARVEAAGAFWPDDGRPSSGAPVEAAGAFSPVEAAGAAEGAFWPDDGRPSSGARVAAGTAEGAFSPDGGQPSSGAPPALSPSSPSAGAEERAAAEAAGASAPPALSPPSPSAGVEERAAAEVPGTAAPPHREPPLTAMRRVTATRMQQAKRTVPHFYLRTECRVDAALGFLAAAKRHSPDAPPTLTDLVVRAAACALRTVPEANSAWVDGAVRVYDRVDVAVAVNTPHGLVAPVVRGAERKDLGAIARETRALAARARGGRLAPAEYAGGTFTISNLGMYGVESLFAIVNPPQSCILGVGAATRRPVATGDRVGVGSVMACTLSADHRVIDGAAGAALLEAIRSCLEQPGLMLLRTETSPPHDRGGPG